MKIGILTASRTDNHGTDLQALAMQNLFRRMGAEDVEIIDYICKKIDTSTRIKINAHNFFSFQCYSMIDMLIESLEYQTSKSRRKHIMRTICILFHIIPL